MQTLTNLVLVGRIILAVAVVGGTATRLLGQSYDLKWSTADGGGGTSTGGDFSLSGTVGQPDAGRLTGSGFTLQGGFWGVIDVVQTPGAPQLAVTRNPGNGLVTVSWPRPAVGWVLDLTPGLSPPPLPNFWTQVSPANYQTNATHIFYSEQPAPPENRIYRLRKL